METALKLHIFIKKLAINALVHTINQLKSPIQLIESQVTEFLNSGTTRPSSGPDVTGGTDNRVKMGKALISC